MQNLDRFYTTSDFDREYLRNETISTRSQAVARIADRTAKNCRVTWPRPLPLSGKFICAPARHCPYKAVYQIWSLGKFFCAPARHFRYKAAYQIWSL